MVDYVLKYKTGNLIIIYYYAYFKLLSTIGDIIWNSIEMIRVDEWLE